MNSYNENLRSSVVSSLSQQENALKKISSSLDAAMFSVYYAEGARMTASEKLKASWQLYQEQQDVQDQAVLNNNIAVNMKAAATQEKTYVDQTVSNTAVAASNVQIATNAIVKLASDIGSVFTIANAADFDSQIYQQAEDARKYMDRTAYDAEVASQLAMESSMLASEVSASNVSEAANTTSASVKTMMDTLSAQFDATAAVMSADSDAVSEASDVEKKAEGVLEDTNVEYYATKNAYFLTNSELNINLRVPTGEKISNTSFQVQFDPLLSPFPPNSKEKPGYPVSDYYILLVKNDKKNTFSITSAEAIVQLNKNDSFIELGATPEGGTAFNHTVNTAQIMDTDGDPVDLGQEYVVFIYAKLSTDYQQTLNNFENFLSAPSNEFELLNTLNAPEPAKIKTKKNPNKEIEIHFELEQDENYDVDYRVMFLPDSRELVKGLLTAEGLRSLEQEVEKLEEIADKYDPKIAKLTSDISSLEAAISATEELLKNEDLPEKEQEKAKADLRVNKKKLHESKKEKRKLEKERNQLERSIDPIKSHSKPGFFFNLTLAEQVPAGSYIPVEKLEHHKSKDGNKVKGSVTIEDDTTDNFGNALMKSINYIPAVLAVPDPNKEDEAQFICALSDFTKTSHFKY